MRHTNTSRTFVPQYIPASPLRVALLDDDPAYREIFKATATMLGMIPTTYASLEEMTSLAVLGDNDLFFIDFYLESMNGNEIAEYIDMYFPDLPVFLISADEKLKTYPISAVSIKKIFSKCQSPIQVLKEAETYFYKDSAELSEDIELRE